MLGVGKRKLLKHEHGSHARNNRMKARHSRQQLESHSDVPGTWEVDSSKNEPCCLLHVHPNVRPTSLTLVTKFASACLASCLGYPPMTLDLWTPRILAVEEEEEETIPFLFFQTFQSNPPPPLTPHATPQAGCLPARLPRRMRASAYNYSRQAARGAMKGSVRRCPPALSRRPAEKTAVDLLPGGFCPAECDVCLCELNYVARGRWCRQQDQSTSKSMRQ